MRWLPLLLLAGLLTGAQAPWTRLAEASRLAERDPVAARSALEALVLEHPGFAPARFNLGTLLLTSDAERAAEHLAAATAHPGTALAADAWHNLALARWKQGRLEDAITCAEQALTLRPEELDYRTTRDELRRAFLVQQDELRRKREEEAKRLRLSSDPLPEPREGEPYSAQITALGGSQPYHFVAESLPEGLQIAADGMITGIPGPKTAGRHPLKITVTDAAKSSVNGSSSLNVKPRPRITTTELDDGIDEAVIGFPFAASLSAEGLDSPLWSATGLPEGLTIHPDGRIDGVPKEAGAFTFRARAADRTHHAEQDVRLSVIDSFAPTPRRPPPATAWAPYEHRLNVRGPAQRYRWEQAAPTAGLVITPDGRVEGAPDAAGDVALPVRIAAADGRTRDVTLTLPVNPPPVIAVDERLTVERGRLLNRPLTVDGGTPPYQWAGTGGPNGVRVDPDGHLRGAATVAGETELIITVTDRWQASSQVTVTVEVTEPQDPSENDQQQQDQQQQDQQQQDQQQQDQQQQDQQQQDEQQQNQQQQDQQPQEQAPQEPAAAQPAEERAEMLSREAAERWMENLPPEDRDVLRLQLLFDQQRPADPGKDPW